MAREVAGVIGQALDQARIAGRLAGAAAFDSPCDLAAQCCYLTNRPPAPDTDPVGVAARMLEEIGAKPGDVSRFDHAATFFNAKLAKHMTIGQLLDELPEDQSLWDARSPLHFVGRLSKLPFPLKLYWSSHDTIVGNQGTNQTGKLYKQIKAKNPSADVKQVKGLWAHSWQQLEFSCRRLSLWLQAGR